MYFKFYHMSKIINISFIYNQIEHNVIKFMELIISLDISSHMRGEYQQSNGQ